MDDESVKVRFHDSSKDLLLPPVHGDRRERQDQGATRRAGGVGMYSSAAGAASGTGHRKGRNGFKGIGASSLASSAALRQMDMGRAHFSIFPSKPSGVEPPMLLQKMEKIIRSSGLFEDDLGPWNKSRARLDVMRVVFAMYCDSAKVYKPILGMVQREYEAQISSVGEAQSKMHMLQDDLATDKDVYYAKEIELKARWKDKLKKANDAVNEWKSLYEELSKEHRKNDVIKEKLKDDLSEMQAKLDEAEADCALVYEDNERLAKEYNNARHDVERAQDLDRDKTLLQAQVTMLTSQIAEIKTAQEVQRVHYMKQTREHTEQQRLIDKLKRQVADYDSVKERLTPRPDWSSASAHLPNVLPERSDSSTQELVSTLVSRLEPYLDEIAPADEEIEESVEGESGALHVDGEVQPR